MWVLDKVCVSSWLLQLVHCSFLAKISRVVFPGVFFAPAADGDKRQDGRVHQQCGGSITERGADAHSATPQGHPAGNSGLLLFLSSFLCLKASSLSVLIARPAGVSHQDVAMPLIPSCFPSLQAHAELRVEKNCAFYVLVTRT